MASFECLKLRGIQLKSKLKEPRHDETLEWIRIKYLGLLRRRERKMSQNVNPQIWLKHWKFAEGKRRNFLEENFFGWVGIILRWLGFWWFLLRWNWFIFVFLIFLCCVLKFYAEHCFNFNCVVAWMLSYCIYLEL